MTDLPYPNVERKAENCPFYPGCYITGDCGYEDWKTGTCGLPPKEKAEHRAKWLADLTLRNRRWELGKQLAAAAHRGDYDHMLKAVSPEHGSEDQSTHLTAKG